MVVPNAAKSAATLITLGADRLIMSDVSELGPIDPRYVIRDQGRIRRYVVVPWLKAYEEAEQRCQEHPGNRAFQTALAAFDPPMVKQLRLVELRTRKLAERIMKRQGWNFTDIASRLMNVEEFPSHGQMIDWRTAQAMGLKNVRYMPRTDPPWALYWRLYLALSAVAGDRKKVFESRHVTRLG